MARLHPIHGPDVPEVNADLLLAEVVHDAELLPGPLLYPEAVQGLDAPDITQEILRPDELGLELIGVFEADCARVLVALVGMVHAHLAPFIGHQ